MLLTLPGVLNHLQVERVEEIVASSGFQDGRLTAGMAASQVKNNQELKAEREPMEALIRVLMGALSNNTRFNSAVLPMRMADPIVARYQAGNTYGLHVDDAVMGHSGTRFRSDVSMTLFLREPDSYEGGELVIETAFGEQQVKLPAGDAVIYPSSSLHRVAPVSSGERLVVLFWIQSHVRDPARREMLFDLNTVREGLLREDAGSERARLADKSFSNLMRMWADV
jgi:PKHD-type hydroxylase